MESHECLGYTYDQIEQVAKFLQKAVPNFTPKVGIICGSGLGPLADGLQDKVEVPYEDIPLFPTSTVAGHGGKLVFGKVGDVPVVCMKGRFHAYEVYPLWKVVMPVRVMRLLGAESLIVTNAAGGTNDSYNVGDMMIIKDHINMMGMGGQNPLRGPNVEEFGPRFPPMNKVYDRGFVKAGRKIAENLGMADFTREGVYACVGGPNYETIAELKMLQMCGVDSVGMSTAHEVIAAAHCGMKVFAFSLISNKAIMDYDCQDVPNHEEVMAATKANEDKLKTFTENMVKYMGGQLNLDCGASGEGPAPPKAEAAPVQIPGICPAAIIQPCPCVSSAQLPSKRVSIQEPGKTEEEGEKEAAEAEVETPKEDGAEEEAKEPKEETKEPEAAEEEPKEPAEAIEEAPVETELIGEAPAVTAAPTQIPGVCPAAIIPPCPCVSSAQLPPPPEAPCAAEAPAEPGEVEEEGEKEAAEAETVEEVGEGGEAPETPKEDGSEEEAKEPEEEVKEPEVAEEEPKEPAEVVEEAPVETGQAPESPVVTGEPTEAADVGVGPEEPQTQDYQSQTVEDRGDQTEASTDEAAEPIQEVGIQMEESTIEGGVAIQTLPETAEVKVGIEEPIEEEPAAEEVVVSVETSTEAPVEAPTEKPVEAPSEAPAEEATVPPEAVGEEAATGEATEETKEETEPAAEVSGEAEEEKPPGEAAEAPSEVAEAPGPVKEVAPKPPVVCSATVKVQCKSFATCILREANVGPDTPIQLAGPPVEEANVGPDAPTEPDVQEPTLAKKEGPCIAPCKKFVVRKKGDRCPTTCPSKKS